MHPAAPCFSSHCIKTVRSELVPSETRATSTHSFEFHCIDVRTWSIVRTSGGPGGRPLSWGNVN
jgi:hypothetical protein